MELRQGVGTIGYRFNERWSAQLGYRYMNFDREVDGRDVTVDLYGPIIGASISF
jgi:hypothetical protein